MKFSCVALGAFVQNGLSPNLGQHSWFQSSVTPIVVVSLHLGKAPCCNWLFHWVHHLLSSGSPLTADLCLHLLSLSGLSSTTIRVGLKNCLLVLIYSRLGVTSSSDGWSGRGGKTCSLSCATESTAARLSQYHYCSLSVSINNNMHNTCCEPKSCRCDAEPEGSVSTGSAPTGAGTWSQVDKLALIDSWAVHVHLCCPYLTLSCFWI